MIGFFEVEVRDAHGAVGAVMLFAVTSEGCATSGGSECSCYEL